MVWHAPNKNADLLIKIGLVITARGLLEVVGFQISPFLMHNLEYLY